MLLPQARTDALNVQEVPGETLVYDLKAKKAHCLNRLAALVWKRCDGKTTPAEIAVALQAMLGQPTDESVVRLALEQLGRRGLLLEPVAPPPEAVRLKRRAFLKGLVKAGAVAVAVPLIMTITAPGKAAAASVPSSNQTLLTHGQVPCVAGQACIPDFPNQCGDGGFCNAAGEPVPGKPGQFITSVTMGNCSCG